jgi:CHAD domain-containing protein
LPRKPATLPQQLTRKLRTDPAQRSARRIARARLERVSETYQRFRAGDDRGLHDFRVALRRLRSWLKAFRPELDDTVGRRLRRSLEKLADATNAARDAEIGLAWARNEEPLSAPAQRARKLLREEYEAELDAAADVAAQHLSRKLAKTTKDLSDALEFYWLRVGVAKRRAEISMGTAMANLLRQHADRLARAAARVESPADVDESHRARIAAKHLRYLLEALQPDDQVTDLIARLTAIQDALGEFHDAHLIVERIAREIGDTAKQSARDRAGGDGSPPTSRTRVEAGLAELAERAHVNGSRAFDTFRTNSDVRGIVEAVAAVADAVGGDRR